MNNGLSIFNRNFSLFERGSDDFFGNSFFNDENDDFWGEDNDVEMDERNEESSEESEMPNRNYSYQSSFVSRSVNGNTVSRHRVNDSRKGKREVFVRKIDDKEHRIEKIRDLDGKESENHDYKNIEEDEIEEFDRSCGEMNLSLPIKEIEGDEEVKAIDY